MKLSEKTLALIAKSYPHCLDIVKAFAPLLECKSEIVNILPPCSIPSVNPQRMADGKVWLDPSIHIDLYLDAVFLGLAPGYIARGITAGFPAMKEETQKIEAVLEADATACRSLASCGLERAKTATWAKQHQTGEDATHFFAAHLGGAAAERVALHARKISRFDDAEKKADWDHAYCPVCGGPPHVSLVRNKEGQRFLQCSTCMTEWVFSRTTCPSCGETTLKKLPYFFLKDNSQDRAQTCQSCNTYILEKDLRNDAGDVPLELYLLCLGALDLLMQEKGYTPILDKGTDRHAAESDLQRS